jgi:hypothetical protein
MTKFFMLVLNLIGDDEWESYQCVWQSTLRFTFVSIKYTYTVQTLIELSKSKTLISSSGTVTQLVNKLTPYMETHFHGSVHVGKSSTDPLNDKKINLVGV